MNTNLDEQLASCSEQLGKEIQEHLRGGYLDFVRKEAWPKAQGIQLIQIDSPAAQAGESFGYAERSYSLWKSAIQTPDICLDDLKFQWQIEYQLKTVRRILVENLRWVWKLAFRRDIINTIQNRSIARTFTDDLIPNQAGTCLAADVLPRKVNFFGKEVQPYVGTDYRRSKKWTINPKYKRAAIQYVGVHEDIVHFLFPNPEQWSGEIAWKNILDRECNPDGRRGFFRVLLCYAAKPIRYDLGCVITVPPPGFIGTLWYWAWKLIGYVP